MAKFSGVCLCGSVKYEGDGEPAFIGKCHCTDCRKACGGGHAALAAFGGDDVKITGEVRGFDLKADSGATVTHHFCPNCGVRVFNTNTAMAGMNVIYLNTLDDPEVFKPNMTVYASRALSWDQADQETHQFAEMPPMGG